MKAKAPTNLGENITQRPPVVVIMGHIDHGKSTLLDFIRKTNITGGEAGGITQHLGAYEVLHTRSDTHKECKITFLDTPGHEAFCAIRERGAHVADIAILVVSAEDGVRPQTIEALKCITSENIPYIVAVNKIDKPGADLERTRQSLAEHEIYVEGYGGEVPIVPISALKGTGIPDLLDMIMLVADLQDLKADTHGTVEGTVIEAHLDSKKGITASLLIKNGTLESGMYVVSGDAVSPVRIFEDFRGKPIKSATFSSPVRVIGFNKVPTVGSTFIALTGKKEAEELSSQNAQKAHVPEIPRTFERADESIVSVPLIIKADVTGSLDGIKHELTKISHDKVKIKIVSQGVGVVNENDVKTALSNPNITILSFNAEPDSKARSILERSSVNFKSFDIIYNLIEYVRDIVSSKIPKEYLEEATGTGKILAVFSKTKDKQILGGKVQTGLIAVGSEVKILRRDVEIGRGKIKELQQQKVKSSEVKEGFEFGTLIESKIEIAVGDKIQCFVIIEKKS